MFDKGRSVLEQKAVAAVGIKNELTIGNFLVDEEAVWRGYHVIVLSTQPSVSLRDKAIGELLTLPFATKTGILRSGNLS